MHALTRLVQQFPSADVLVVGDAVLDCWLSGPSHRLCREAPVPVVAVDREQVAPGGAANTAANLAALGGTVTFASLVGDDRDGELLRAALRRNGVDDGEVVSVPGGRTPAKRRVLAGSQMLARFDEGGIVPVPPPTEALFLDRLETLVRRSSAVLVCDYGLGLLTDRARALLTDLQRETPRLLVVDAHEPQRWASAHPTAVTPNYEEVCALLPEAPAAEGADRVRGVIAQADVLFERSGAETVAATLDAEGAVLLERGRPPHRTYATAVPAAQTAGAGDSFAAAFTLALAAGADGPAAVETAAAAAAVVVGTGGTSVCTADDLLRALGRTESSILPLDELDRRMRAYRAEGRRLVFTNGCFDVLHRGHVAYLNQAKQQGDVLVVGINSDASVGRLKGPDRPVNPVEDRAAVLAALSCVDHIAVFDEDSPRQLLEVVRPQVYVKGGDYTPQMLQETPVVERLGGEVRILDYLEDRSTTGILQRIRASMQDTAEGSR